MSWERVMEFEELVDLLEEATNPGGFPELHGYLCGGLCGGVRPDERQWFAMASEFTDVPDWTDEEKEQLAEVLHATVDYLGSEDLNFQPLIPDDEYGLAERATALACWCEGFLVGFGSASVTLDDEAQEVVHDFTEMSRLEVPEDENEEEASDFEELLEYVRMATVGLFLGSSEQRASGDH